ncbi:MAG TPA: hypothetical protein VE645_04295 [Pseudonocardiaceae bacterium]|nr:hypothetical protein [Pseudonocardiaceae bacterium]
MLLAGVRLANGTTGLVAPQLLIRRIDPAQAVSPAGIYAFRLFGVRTMFLGAELLIRRDAQLQHGLREGLVIHASDVATSVLVRGAAPGHATNVGPPSHDLGDHRAPRGDRAGTEPVMSPTPRTERSVHLTCSTRSAKSHARNPRISDLSGVCGGT